MIIAVFKQRSETINFYEGLQKHGVASKIINTPRQARIGCGISVAVNRADFERAKEIMASLNFSSFVGYFSD